MSHIILASPSSPPNIARLLLSLAVGPALLILVGLVLANATASLARVSVLSSAVVDLVVDALMINRLVPLLVMRMIAVLISSL
jgi:hypothetical protein